MTCASTSTLLNGCSQHLAQLLCSFHPDGRYSHALGQADPIQGGVAQAGEGAGGGAGGRQALAGALHLTASKGQSKQCRGDVAQLSSAQLRPGKAEHNLCYISGSWFSPG